MNATMNWRSLFSENIVKGSEQYINKDAVVDVNDDGVSIKGIVKGMENFRVEAKYTDGVFTDFTCSCPFSKAGQKCKHMSAVLLYAENKGIININESKQEEIPKKLEVTKEIVTQEEAKAELPVAEKEEVIDSEKKEVIEKVNAESSQEEISKETKENETNTTEAVQTENSQNIHTEEKFSKDEKVVGLFPEKPDVHLYRFPVPGQGDLSAYQERA